MERLKSTLGLLNEVIWMNLDREFPSNLFLDFLIWALLIYQTKWMISACDCQHRLKMTVSTVILRTNPRIIQPIMNPEVFPSTEGQ